MTDYVGIVGGNAGKQFAQSISAAFQPEQTLLRGVAHIGVHQQDLLTGVAERNGKIGDDGAFSHRFVGGGDAPDRATALVVDGVHQIGAEPVKRLPDRKGRIFVQ